MASEPTIRELHKNLTERLRSSGIDKKTAEKRADESLKRVGDKLDRK